MEKYSLFTFVVKKYSCFAVFYADDPCVSVALLVLIWLLCESTCSADAIYLQGFYKIFEVVSIVDSPTWGSLGQLFTSSLAIYNIIGADYSMAQFMR